MVKIEKKMFIGCHCYFEMLLIYKDKTPQTPKGALKKEFH